MATKARISESQLSPLSRTITDLLAANLYGFAWVCLVFIPLIMLGAGIYSFAVGRPLWGDSVKGVVIGAPLAALIFIIPGLLCRWLAKGIVNHSPPKTGLAAFSATLWGALMLRSGRVPHSTTEGFILLINAAWLWYMVIQYMVIQKRGRICRDSKRPRKKSTLRS